MKVYCAREAKARFSEILRQVRAGQPVRISYRGREVAEIRPLADTATTLEERLAELERQGVLIPAERTPGKLRPVAHAPGGLDRFLAGRD